MHPRVREALQSGEARRKSSINQARGVLTPAKTGHIDLMASDGENNTRAPSQDAGFMGLLMPLYSIIVIAFLVYTLCRLLNRESTEMQDTHTVSTPTDDPVTSDTIKNLGVYDWSQIENMMQQPSFAIIEETKIQEPVLDEQIHLLTAQLEDKERAMTKLLVSIDELSGQLALSGILPRIPSLFIRRNQQLRSLDPRINVSQEKDDLLRKLATGSQKKLSSSVVSDALQLLIYNMEILKRYLVDIERLREKLNQLKVDEAEQLVSNRDEDDAIFSHEFNPQTHESRGEISKDSGGTCNDPSVFESAEVTPCLVLPREDKYKEEESREKDAQKNDYLIDSPEQLESRNTDDNLIGNEESEIIGHVRHEKSFAFDGTEIPTECSVRERRTKRRRKRKCSKSK